MINDSNKKIINLSNNIFDTNFLSKKEYIEMVDNFIATVKLLGNTNITNEDINNQTIETMTDFGFINTKDDIVSLETYVGKVKFTKLIISINNIISKNLMIFPDLLKYNKRFREEEIKKIKNENKPTLVDLFCGAGGLSLGLTQENFRVIFANDIDKSALRTYAFNHPEIDGNNITMGGIEEIATHVHDFVSDEVDLLAGGPPCQGFSMANRQRIIDDPRNVLYKYYVECVKNLLPKFFIMENVKGMKNVAQQVVEDFNQNIKVGYNIAYEVFNAKEFGIPQNRERLIYIGVREDIKDINNITALGIIEEIKKLRYNRERVLLEAIDTLPKLSASQIKNNTELENDVVGYKITTNNSQKNNDYIDEINLGNSIKLTFNHKSRFNNDRDIEIFGRMIPGDKSDSPRIADIMPYTSRSHMFKDKYFKLLPDKPCKTITAHMKFDCNMYIHPFQARGLTPREAARIQSYPDDYFFLGSYTKTYMQIGNSVPPLLSRKFGNIIKKYLN